MLPAEILNAYRDSRSSATDTSVLCHAPFVSLNFEQTGNVTSCCYNRSFVLGTYPQQSLREIWGGAPAREFRNAFRNGREARGCDLCFHQLRSGNFAGTLMRNFDPFAQQDGYEATEIMPYPKVLEFEIANTCNLECVMCDGRWSSSIRARREKLPPLRSPYDHAFVEQLEEFLPFIAHAKFLGGEPFLIRRYYEIWESIHRLNPNAGLTITTNATFVPDRAKELLEGLRADIVVSLDAITPTTYESIRRNAHLDVVLEHVDYLLAYTQRRGTGLTLAVCPMTHNWRELHQLVEFAEQRHIGVHFNLVVRPIEASLVSLTPTELTEVIEYLETVRLTGNEWSTARNRERVAGLTHQVTAWRDEKSAFDARTRTLANDVRRFARDHLKNGVLPEGVDRLVDPFTYAYLVGHELENAPHWDLRNLLPQPPLSLWPDAEFPRSDDLILTGTLVGRYVDSLVDSQPSDGAAICAELEAIREYLLIAPTRVGARADQLHHVGDWIRERLMNAESATLLSSMRDLRRSINHEMLVERGVGRDVDRRLPNALEIVQRAGWSDVESASAAAYLRASLWERIEGAWAPAIAHASAHSDAHVIRGVAELRQRLGALFLYYLCVHPSGDATRFGQRLTGSYDMIVAAGRIDDACRMVDRAGVAESWQLLANASDDDLMAALTALIAS